MLARSRPRPPARPRRSQIAELIVAGRGNLGRSLGAAFRAAGHPVQVLPARDGTAKLARTVRGGSILFVAVPDGAVTGYAARLARLHIAEGAGVVHVSGTLGLDALAPLRPLHAIGSFHPLQSFPSPRPPEAFRGITVAVDASTPALHRRLARLAREVGATPRRVENGERALYHAAAVFASNYLIAVVYEGVRLLEAAGWRRGDAERALLPLVEGVTANLRRQGTVRALTGPIRRGDAGPIARHLQALEGLRQGPPPAAAYRMLGTIALEIAKEAGLEPVAAKRISRALTRKVAATRRRGRS